MLMRSRILITVELTLAMFLTVVVVGVVLKSQATQGAPFDKLVAVDATQLPLRDGIIPIEVRCESARLTAPGRLEAVSCMAINHTRQRITALSSVLTVITENDTGVESRNTNILYDDSFVHPDIKEVRHLRSTAPGESRTIQPGGPMTFEDEVIVGINLRIDYVEFDDGTSIGSDSKGGQVIKSVREGAARYKRWLVKKCAADKSDADGMVPLLQQSDTPAESQIGDDKNMKEGATIYRNFLLSVYERQGRAELKRLLDK
jgi:hypothetical protein